MSDYLSEEEQLAQLKAAWQRYGLPVVVAGVLAAAGFVGWRWLESNSAAEVAAASERYDAFLDAEGDARSALFEELRRDYGDSGYAALALLALAGEAVADGDLDAAAGQLEEAVTTAPEAVLKDLARVRLARVRQQLGDSEAALAALAAVRGAGYRPLALELKGDIHMTRGERADAHKAYLAARDALQEGMERPLLSMKVTDTADALRPDAASDAAAEGAAEATADASGETVPAGAAPAGATPEEQEPLDAS